MSKLILYFCIAISSFNLFAQVPNEALTFDTNVQLINASSTQAAKIQAAEEHIKKVIATQAFKDAVINHTYNGKKTYVDNGGFTNEQIYNKILQGAEELQPTKNNAMDIEVELYYNGWTSTVGYTYPDTKRIWVNTKFFNSYTIKEVAGNLTHEWLHKLGFTHAVSYSTSRDYSVPYAIGRIMESLSGSTTTVSTGLSAPTNLTVSQSSTQVTLKWNASTGAKEYKVYRRMAGATTAYLQGTTTSLTFTQNIPSSNATYYVRAVDATGKTAKSAEVSFIKASGLTAVSNLTLTKSTTTVTLKWGAATSSAGIKEYKVYRRLDGSTTNYLQRTTSSLSFSQSLPSKSATYYVRSVDMTGKTVKSVEVRLVR